MGKINKHEMFEEYEAEQDNDQYLVIESCCCESESGGWMCGDDVREDPEAVQRDWQFMLVFCW